MHKHARMLGVAAFAAALASATPAAAAPKGSPWGASYFPNYELTTHEGKKVRFYDDLVKDRMVVVDFIYTRCAKQCGLMTANLARVQRLVGERLGRDIFFYSISLDPERDTPEVLKAYAEAFKARPGWTFLTGKKDEIAALRRRFGDLTTVEEHSANLMIGNDATGQWFANGALDDPQYLAMIISNWLDPAWATRDEKVKPYTEAPRIAKPTEGQTIFNGKCAACHARDGSSVGPGLLGVTSRRDRAWLTRWIMAPEKLIAGKDPAALELLARYEHVPMPNMDLDEADARAVLEYIDEATRIAEERAAR